jgi:hypothetical protein
MWLSFLYGHAMWVCPPEGEGEGEGEGEERWAGGWDVKSFMTMQDFCALTGVHQLGLYCEDYDAVDAALDCMRNLLERYVDTFKDPFQGDLNWDGEAFETSYGRLIADYMVYKPCKFTEWMETYSRSDWAPGEDIDKALAKRFAEKSQRKEDGIPQPDLMERCWYHLHVEKGLPCYLDK